MRRSIADIIKDTVSLIEDAPDTFFAAIIKKVEQSLNNAVGRIINKFDITDGLFSGENETAALAAIDDELKSAIGRAGLKKAVNEYKVNFNLVEDLTREYYEATLKKAEVEDLVDLFKQTRTKKANIIRDLDLYLLNEDVLQANVLNEIRDEIFESVVLKGKVSDLQESLRKIIVTEDGSNSKLLRYTRQIATDALGEYKGTLQEKGREKYGLDKMTYSGTILNTTRQFCYDLLMGKGRYEKFALRRGVYRYEDLEEILELSTQCVPHHYRKKKNGTAYIDCGNGLKPGTTPENFGSRRGGFGCLHTANYSRMTERDRRVAKEKGLS